MPVHTPGPNGSEQDWDDYFASHGKERLRILIQTGGLPQSLTGKALDWLARQDQAAVLRDEASQAEQIDIARSAKDAAWAAARAAERAATAAEKANARATVALVIAAISIASTIVGILVTHWDAIHGH